MEEHGSFTIEISDRLLLVTVADKWNLETSIRYCQELRRFGAKMRGEPWAILADLRDWKLGPPEVRELMHGIAAELDELDRTHTAMIANDNIVIAQIVEDFRNSAPTDSNASFFASPAEARQWLADSGFE